MKRNIYLDNVSIEEAREKWENGFELEPGREKVDIREARGRITARPVYAGHCSPHYHASAMDGIAVRAEKTAGASEVEPVTLSQGRDYQFVDTGDRLPEGFNAVIKIEEVNQIDETTVAIEAPATPWQHVRNIGESMVSGELLLPVDREIGPHEIGLALEGGVTEVTVYSQPRVAILPTGNELKPPGEKLKPGEITEYNSAMIANLVTEWGGEPLASDIIPDDFSCLCEEVKAGVSRAELVVIIAGSSAGEEDYTREVIAELGSVLVHGISMKPGGPAVLGVIGNTPVLGLPGYPVAAALTSRLFLRSLVYRLAGRKVPVPEEIRAELATKVVSKPGVREFVRVKLARLEDKLVAATLARASGVLGSLVEADGLVVSSEFSEGFERREEVKVRLLERDPSPEQTLLVSGSNDLSLDIIKNFLAKEGIDLLCKSTGSLGGLTSLKRRECHLAGIHLLDPETETYNQSYLEKYLSDREVMLINLAFRQQGLMVKPGNPHNITAIEDLTEEEVVFLNRQRGSGTRILFDHLLAEEGLSSEQITGYERVEYTHLTLAAEIAGGGADTGLGISAAAEAFDLEFIPVATERFDLVIPVQYRDDERVDRLIKVLRSSEFKTELEKMSGYSARRTGEVITDGGKND